ncbi:MAG: FAD-dependent oxidoreductase, partial [Micrococcales bacterium]|nr:FAD-dependent oxidoreductase [Micrococcales bacterium]
MGAVNARSSRVVILGGGPGGYEAALVAAHLGAEVTVVERTGIGGAAVLTDCVPSKTLISTADYLSDFETAADLGARQLEDATVDLG